MTKQTFLFIILILFGVIIYYFFHKGLVKIYNSCEESKEIYDLMFKGIVLDKKDTRVHHASRYILVGNGTEDDRKKLDLLGDVNINKSTGKSIFWETINVGDSVSKNKGTFVVSYKKVNLDWVKMRLGFDLCR